MKKNIIKKRAKANSPVINDKGVQENRENMNLSNEQQGVVGKNINLSLPIKDKDSSVPFNQQLESSRRNDKSFSIIEGQMDKREVNVNSKGKKQVADINIESRKYMDEQSKKYKDAESATDSNTEFWDKYVGVQMEEDTKKIDNNVPPSASQLPNSAWRFEEGGPKRMVMASLRDADAMLFHLYATAASEKRNFNEEERQQIIDINSSKMRIIAEAEGLPQGASVDPVIKREGGIVAVYEASGLKLDEFGSFEEARQNYPEGRLSSELV